MAVAEYDGYKAYLLRNFGITFISAQVSYDPNNTEFYSDSLPIQTEYDPYHVEYSNFSV